MDIKQPQALNGLLNYAIGMAKIYPPGTFGYIWGAQGQVITEAELTHLKAFYGAGAPGGPGYYDSARARAWIGKPAADCSGLIMYMFCLMGIYSQDKNANTLYLGSSTHSVKEAKPGDLLFKIKNGRAVHVGILITGNRAVHCRGTDYGLVTTTEKEYPWHIAGTYPGVPNVKPVHAIDSILADKR